MVEQPPTVMVIDDDPGVRDSLGKLLRSAGFRVSLFGSVSEFLEADRQKDPLAWCLRAASRPERTRTAARTGRCQKTAANHLHYRTW